MLQSHGWIEGALLAGSLQEAAAAFDPADKVRQAPQWPRSRADFVLYLQPALAVSVQCCAGPIALLGLT